MTKPHRAKTPSTFAWATRAGPVRSPRGPPDSDQFVDWRHRLAGAARHYRTASRGKTEHRTTGIGWRHRHRRWGFVHSPPGMTTDFARLIRKPESNCG